VVLGILAHKPPAIHLIGTTESGKTYRQILSEVEKYWQGMPRPTYNFEVEPSSSADAFSKIVLEWNKLKEMGIKEPKKVAIDITGGKKTMVSGAFTAAAIYGFDIWYVDSGEYDPILQTPVPGTERYIEVLNPLDVFSIKDRQNAENLFNNGRYQEAYELLNRAINLLKREEYADFIKGTEIVQEVEKLYPWAQMYSHWDRMEYTEALTAMEQIGISQDDIRYEALETLASIDSTRKEIMEYLESEYKWILDVIDNDKDQPPSDEELKRLKKQYYESEENLEGERNLEREANTRTLEKLYRDAVNDSDRFPFFFALDLYLSAIRLENRVRYDDALLRMNRAIEIWGQYCLYRDGSAEPLRPSWTKKIGKFRIKLPLSWKITDLMKKLSDLGRITKEQFNRIDERIEVRNNLSITHSIGNCNKDDLAALKEEANKILDDFSKNYLCARKKEKPNEKEITYANLIERLTFKKAEEILNKAISSTSETTALR
jgi:tetratricopeptide (TPR) repeat protein